MASKNLNVLIAGGSLGGLIHGLTLKRHGHRVTIIEKNLTTSMANLGAGLACSPDMISFMSQYDLVQEPYFIETSGMRVLDVNGEDDPSKEWPGYRQKSTNWNTLFHRLRANFDGLESGYCDVPARREGDGEARYMDGCTVENVEFQEGEETVKVVYSDVNGEERRIEGDLLIATDGPSSKVRRILQPDVERKYVGYIVWRGIVPEKEISQQWRDLLGAAPIMCPIGNSCTISYMIPSPDGALSGGNRIFNWAWYRHYAFNSEEYNDLMTDNVTNEPHRYTLPLGRLRAEHAMALKKSANELLAPCISELIQKTHQPFIQSITDLVSPKAAFFGGKVLLAGDALATLRPTSGLGLNAAARSSIMLLEVLEGRMGVEEWEEEAVEFARKARLVGIRNAEFFTLRKSSEEAAEGERNIVRVPRIKS